MSFFNALFNASYNLLIEYPGSGDKNTAIDYFTIE